LFGEVWSRNDILSLHDRSIVTICALVGGGVLDSSLKYHIQSAKKNGVTKAEMVEIITQLGFYVGWPKAWAVFPMAQEVYAEEAKDASERGLPDLSVFPIGEKNDAYAKYFDGQSWLSVISKEQVSIANVTFEPGCRNHWHIHRAKSGGGQMLVVTAGRGWYQERGEPARELRPGDVVHIPANVEHWHGAAKDSWFQHLAIEVPGEETSTEWSGPVSVEGYEALR
ncbi:MAG: carboxymuconolactone decarboxylase family protein, partial [Synergistaceae bacterium]|nr:carboxymuconolactone decarboxylase family protein [Synergistaceae bacterium]